MPALRAARAAQRRDPGRHRARPAAGHPARRGGRGRAGLRHPRARQPAARRRRQPRPHRRPGRRDAARRRRPGGQLRGRPALPRHRPPTAGGRSDERRPRARRPRRPSRTAGRRGPAAGRSAPASSSAACSWRWSSLMALVSFVWTPYDPTLVDAADAAARRPRRSTGWAPTSSAATSSARSWWARGPRCSSASSRSAWPRVIGVPARASSRRWRRGWVGEVADARQRPAARVPRAAAGDHVRRGLRRPARSSPWSPSASPPCPSFARLVRSGGAAGDAHRVRAGRPRGRPAPVRRSAVRHVLPNVGSLVIVQASVAVRHRRAGRGGAVLPRPRHPAADAVVGPDAAGEPGAAVHRAAAGALPRARDRRSPCSGSTCSATACATASTRGWRTADERRRRSTAAGRTRVMRRPAT